MSLTEYLIPGLTPLFWHAVSDQKMDGGKAREQLKLLFKETLANQTLDHVLTAPIIYNV